MEQRPKKKFFCIFFVYWPYQFIYSSVRKMSLFRSNLRLIFPVLQRNFSKEAAISQLKRFDRKLPIASALTPPSSWFNSEIFHQLDKVILRFFCVW